MSASLWQKACPKTMRRVRLILQARMSSSRLPGKMLLPVGGLPLIVLCAKRALRGTDYDLVVATTDDPSDDALIPVLEQHKIKYIRGPLHDVLKRFVIASDGMEDDDLVVRLTGDNPVVDSDFIKLILESHDKAALPYTRSLSPFDRLPYGASAEVIEPGLLRRLDKGNPTDFEREHVTIHYTLESEYNLFESPLPGDLSLLRCTVDTQEDYDSILKLFEGEDALNVSWKHLIRKLAVGQTAFRTPYKRYGLKARSIFALGTVQLGLPYGIANISGQPDPEVAGEILETALAHGVTWIDTAAAYGDSEKIIGAALNGEQKSGALITTKLAPDAVTEEAAIQSVEQSLSRLGITMLPYLLLHRWSQQATPAWDALLKLQEQKKIGLLGVSIQSPEEGLEALKVRPIKFIQMPFNICDGRWEDFIHARKKREDVHLQVRTSLLQGVFTLPPERWPLEAAKARDIHEKLENLVRLYNRKSITDLCYAYVRSQNWIDSVVVGVETREQLIQNLHLFNEPKLKDFLENPLAMRDEQFLNPALWPKEVS